MLGVALQGGGASFDEGLQSILKRRFVVRTSPFGKRDKEWSGLPFTQKLCDRVTGNRPIRRGLPRALLLKEEAVDIVGERSNGAQGPNGIEAKGHHRLKLLIKGSNGSRAKLLCSSDDPSAVRIGQQGGSIGARAARKPLLPGFTGTRWPHACSPNEGVGHRVQEFLLATEVPVECRRLDSQLICETPGGQPIKSNLFEKLQGRLDHCRSIQ